MIIQKFYYSLTLILAMVFFSANVYSNDFFKIDNTFAVVHDTNVLRQAEKISDTSFVYSPKIKLTGRKNQHSYTLNYNGNFNKFKRNELLDYNDHTINFITRLEATSKLSSFISLRYEDTVEEPGINDAATETLNFYNTFDRKTALLRTSYGKRQSIGQIILAVQHDDFNYTNNNQEFRDFKSNRFTGIFYYRVAPKTRLLLETRFTDFNYKDRFITNNLTLNQSNKLNVFLTGVEWRPSVKLQTNFTIGYQTQTYEDDSFNDIDSLFFSLDTTWKPNKYTEIEFNAERVTEQSALVNSSSFIATRYDLDFTQNISEKTEVNARVSIQNNDIVSINERTDIRSTLQIGLKHELVSWINLALNLQRRERSSDISDFEFDATVAEISITIKLD